MARKALGKGLGALIPTEEVSERQFEHEGDGFGRGREETEISIAGDGLMNLRVEEIRANPWQPRTNIEENGLAELADSIRQKGLLQPIIVRKVDDGYELVAGERRFVASKMAGLDWVPAVVKEANNREMLEIALVEPVITNVHTNLTN